MPFMPAPVPEPKPCPLDHLALRGTDDAPALVLRGQTLSWKDLRSRRWLAGSMVTRYLARTGRARGEWAPRRVDMPDAAGCRARGAGACANQSAAQTRAS